MPDTGAPWNIPYVEPSDLVRNYPAASEDLADAVAAGLSAAGNAGIGSNVVQTAKTNTFSTSSTSFVDITDFDATITPSTDTSLILVIADLKIGGTQGSGMSVAQLVRGSTNIYLGGGTSSSITALGAQDTNQNGIVRAASLVSGVAVFLDSPATDLAVTYKLQLRTTNAGPAYLNQTHAYVTMTSASSLTLIEVAV